MFCHCADFQYALSVGVTAPYYLTKLFKEQAEGMLFDAIKTVNEELPYAEYLKALEAINPAVEKFFADVLVMDKDENVKKNRQALLSLLKKKYEVLADFSKL